MSRLFIIIICAFLLSTTTLSAQESDAENIIHISYSEDNTPDFVPETFFAELADELAPYDIEIEIVEDVDDAQIDFFFNALFDGERIYSGVEIRSNMTFDNPLASLSPILYPRIDNINQNLTYEDERSTQLIVATILYGLNNYTDAISLLNSIQIPNQNSPSLFISINWLLGNCNLALGNYQTALSYYQRLLAWRLQNTGIIPLTSATNSAWAYIQLGREDEAFQLMAMVLENDAFWGYIPVNTLTVRAELYALVLDYDLAIADMDRAIALAEENPDQFTPTNIAELYVLRGQIVILLYEWDRVLENYNTALEIAPDYTPAYFYRGILYYSVLAREEALADFETYLTESPDGEYAEQAQQYAESIQIELNALDD